LQSWPIVALLNGTVIVGLLVLFVLGLLHGSWAWAFLGMSIGMFLGATIVAVFLFFPSDKIVQSAIPEAEAEASFQSSILQDVLGQIAPVEEQLAVFLAERKTMIKELPKRLRPILQTYGWKTLRGNQWEEYLVEVCRTLGATVERTGKCGDQGVDLIVVFGAKRVAVQAKGYDPIYAVNNKAVQEAVAGMAMYGCNACAVMTNTRFTPGARQLAESNNCTLIGEDEFPDFVMGKIKL
jgi:HJR/Mrr/RecB family endonuclease